MNKSRTESFFDNYAEGFDALYEHSRPRALRLLDRVLRRSMRLRFERTLAECQPIENRTVLDIGCGPGQYALALAQRGAAHVTGIDFSERMIELAKQKAESHRLADRCVFIKAALEDFSPEQPFDYCVATGFMDYVSDAATTVTTMLSLTRVKAIISFPVASGLLAWQRRIRYRRKCDLFMYNKVQLDELFTSFEDFDCTIEKLHRDYIVVAERKP